MEFFIITLPIGLATWHPTNKDIILWTSIEFYIEDNLNMVVLNIIKQLIDYKLEHVRGKKKALSLCLCFLI